MQNNKMLHALALMVDHLPGFDRSLKHSTNHKTRYDRLNTKQPMNHAAAKRAKIKRRNKRLHPRGCK